MKKFVIFVKQQGEITNAYSIVDESQLKDIPKEAIHKVVDLEDKLYSKEELEVLRDKNI